MVFQRVQLEIKVFKASLVIKDTQVLKENLVSLVK